MTYIPKFDLDEDRVNLFLRANGTRRRHEQPRSKVEKATERNPTQPTRVKINKIQASLIEVLQP